MEATRRKFEAKDMNTYVLRIDRSYRNLIQFKQQLKSYLCEPATIGQYEARERIQRNIDNLTKGHLALLDIYHNKRSNVHTILQTMSEQLKEAKRLEEGITNYINLVQA